MSTHSHLPLSWHSFPGSVQAASLTLTLTLTLRFRTTYALLFAIFLTAAITNCLKVAIGRPRPNFVFRCWPDGTPQVGWGGVRSLSSSQV